MSSDKSFVLTQDVSNEVVLEESLPCGVRGLGEHEEEGEEVGKPEVVSRDWGVLLQR